MNTDTIENNVPLENPAVSLQDPAAWDHYFGGTGTEAGVKISPTIAMGHPPLWRAVSLISGSVAKLPVDVFRRLPEGAKEKDTLHPAQRLLKKRSSRYIKAFTLKQTLVGHALLRGNGYAYIERNNRGDATQLVLLDPDVTFPAMEEAELWYVTEIRGEQTRIPSRDVFHVRGLSNDGMKGYDIVTLMAEALSVGVAASRFGARFFGQGANVSGILQVPGHFNEAKIKATMDAWGKMNQGLSNSHKVALLQDGTKFVPLTVNPAQSQFLETREYEVRTIANITGCPPHKLGDPTRTSHNSLEAENESFLNDCLDHWLCEIESEANVKLLSDTQQRTDSHFVEFNRRALLRMSANDRANFYTKMQMSGNMTINEVRNAENMPPVENGDALYRPANLLEIGEQPEQGDAPTTAAALSEFEIAGLIQKVYLGVGKVVTAEEARQLVTQAGFNLEDEFVPDTAQPLRIEPPEPTEDSSAAAASLRAMVGGSVSRSLQIEKDRVMKAAKTENNFLAWVDTFYPQWVSNATIPASGAESALQTHAQASKIALLDVAGSCSQTSLPGAVAECVATWTDERGEIITNTIMESTTNE
jgi:HK97 family phage portal protein